jgi:hypothetical protein
MVLGLAARAESPATRSPPSPGDLLEERHSGCYARRQVARVGGSASLINLDVEVLGADGGPLSGRQRT